MKLTIVALTTLLTLSTAQNLGSEPPCATACLSSAISKAGCAPTDEACQCGPTQASIAAIVGPCLLASCPATQLAAVESIGLALCAQFSAGLSTTTATATAHPTTTSLLTTSLLMGPGPVNISSTVTGTVVVANSTVTTTTSSSASAAGNSSSVASSASSVVSSASAKSSGSATSSAPATASSSAAMALLANGLGGLAALFFGVVVTL